MEVIIGCPALESMQTWLEAGRKEVTLSSEGKNVTLGLKYKRMEPSIVDSLSDNDGEDFMSDVGGSKTG